MCGIFGVISSENSNYSISFLRKSLTNLASLSESRGKDSSGLCVLNQNSLNVIKGPIQARNLLKRNKVKEILKHTFSKNKAQLAFGHARLVTNGSQLHDTNNQPVIKEDIVCVHNGIIVNHEELWRNNPKLKRHYEIDTEILPSLIRKELSNEKSVDCAVVSAMNEIVGTASIALTFCDLNKFVLATNNGSLYIVHNNKDIIYFASEKAILLKLINKMSLQEKIGNFELFQLESNSIFSVDLQNFALNKYFFSEISKKDILCKSRSLNLKINVFSENSDKKQLSTVLDLNKIHLNDDASKERELLIYPIEKIKKLIRCSNCILPETFPFIKYDSKGVCNYCNNYKKKKRKKSLKELQKLVEPYRSNDGSPDCLVPFSGGRDSMYALHVIKKELKLNPIAFTYDWGMVTDLARRNIARICGQLGVEHIIVSADIHWKRANIKKNISAWLKKPSLGMIPLFMAGDKFFFYYANEVKKQTNIKLNIWGINDLENTDFKTGFGGLSPQFNKEKIYSLSLYNQLKLFTFVGSNLIQSPGYFNQSMLDSLGSFASRYISPKSDYYHLFDFIEWNEQIIEDTIINEYNWETSIDTKSTWRIGDGTASFYNYIYTLVAGFSENDTFRSNQIREGMISRSKALNLIYDENQPRYNSLKWYLEIINLDFSHVIKIVNKIPRLY